ncbi:acetyl-CoA synthetase-like protein [Mucidula mucida]|nr:acetyl-CoA synthetase-like protein [Mucidula mucida]
MSAPITFIAPPPNLHLHHANGWTIPPIDGSLGVPELYDFHYAHNPTHPVFVYAKPDGSGLVHIRFAELVPAAHRAGWFVTRITNYDHSASPHVRPCVAVLAASDTITFFTTFIGMLRAHLLMTARPTHVFVSADAAMRELLVESMKLLELDEEDKPRVAKMPVYEDIYTGTEELQLPPRPHDLDATRIIVHSSGSTSFPKPIHWNDRTCGQAAMAPWYGKRNHVGKVFAAHCVAMYHGIGINFMNWIATTGLTLAVFPPSSPATVPSFDNVWEGAVATGPAYVFAPPVFFEIWGQDLQKVTFLKRLEGGLVFGGAPLSKATGHYLAEEGCTLYSLYGITEAGVLCSFFPESPGMDWEYIAINPALSTVFAPQEDGTFELIVISKPYTEIHIVNTRWDKEDAYATNDIFIPHPTSKARWKLIGRKDDQLTLSTGEKTNPTPLEVILHQDPYVAAALMFGRGRFQNGILIQLKPQFMFEVGDEGSIVKYRSLIWPSIEKMNEFAPSHSRIFKEMIIFADPSKPFSFNAKGAPRRSIVLADYDREIEALYKSVQEQIVEEHPLVWTLEASLAFVRTIVNKNLHHPAKDDDDIFECGCDSLQATWIRNTITHALRDRDPAKARSIGTNFVYEHPRISSIADFLAERPHRNYRESVQAMTAMLDKLASPGSFSRVAIPMPAGVLSSIYNTVSFYSPVKFFFPSGDVVLVTGTTGGLGAATLAKLLESSSVRKIYALNRPVKGSGKSLLERQKHAFKSKGYDGALASSSKVVLLEADITEDGLGVDTSLEREIRHSVTHIIHIAWRVDFNLTLSSYDNILKAMRTLVDLALTSPRPRRPRFIFTSSVGVLQRVPPGVSIPEKRLDDPEIAVGQGYSESKWIGEEMLHRAARETSLRPLILRVGQIAGGVNGGWNPSDWVPAIVKSSISLGCLPRFHGQCSWLPLDVAANAILELCHSIEEIDTAHLVHPRPRMSSEIFEVIGERLNLPLVPYGDWLSKLEARSLQADGEDVPALKLLDFFRAGLAKEFEGYEAFGIPLLECEVAKASSVHVRHAKPITSEDVSAWLGYWTRVGFLVRKDVLTD